MNNIVLLSAVEITLAVCIPCAVILLVAAIIIVIRKNNSRKLSANLKSKYNEYHDILTVDCYKSINRLKQLGVYSEKYQSLYEEKLKKFNDMLTYRDKDTYKALNDYSKSVTKSMDQFKNKLNSSERKVLKETAVRVTNEYIKAVSSFNDELNSLLHEDTDAADSSISVKAKYRKVKDFYEANSQELSFVSKSYEIVISDAEKVFDNFSELTNQARYDEAKDLLPKIDAVLSAVLEIQDRLPSLVAKVTDVLPQRIDELENTYREMMDEDYKLTGDVKGEIQHMKDEVAAMKKKLKVLDVSSLGERIDAIQQGITNLQSSFENEKIAKSDYAENKGKIGDSAYELEKRYSRYLNQIPAYQEAYALDQKYVEQMLNLKGEIESINALKRELDSSLTTDNVTEPYSVLNRNINEVLKGIYKANRIIDDYITYTSSLKELSQNIYSNVRKYFLRLKEAESTVRDIKMCDYADKVTPEIESLYLRLEEIDATIMKQPIDVNAAYQKYAPFEKEADALINRIQDDYEDYQKAQYAMMRAMAYKADFADSRPQIDAAESAFRKSDFSTAYVKANDVVKTFSSLRNENV